MADKFQNILITGAEGFIGSHLVEALLAQGRHVRAMALYNSFGRYGWLDTLPEKTRKQIQLVMGDVRDPFSVREAMRGMDAVMHLAALIAIPYSYNAPASYVDVNVMGTLNVLQAARDLGIKKVVHTSTSEVYGTAQQVPIPETHPLVGQSPYSASKIGADQMAVAYYRSFGVPVATARPFNTYGPRQSLRAVIPTIILQALSDNPQLSLGSLHPTRDFNYVADTAEGMIAILDNPRSVGETINIGSGFEITVGDTVKLIGDLTGKKLVVKTDDVRIRPDASEVERLCADASKAKSLLGWESKFSGMSGLKAGLVKSVEWFARPENRAQYHDVHRYTI
ncbi:MAG: NAD-dependent 4,6-dehydratase LegB [Alphaproteobacteria bacterium]